MDHCSPTTEHLVEVERSTFFNTVKPFDSSDHIQGRMLSFISKIIGPRLVVEIGTFSGYGTLCLCEGLCKDGKIITIEHDQQKIELIEHHLKATDSHIEVLNNSAMDVLPNIMDPIDLVFVDAAKKEYAAYYDILIPKMKKGAVMIVDNVLWKGEVIKTPKSKIALALDDFNQKVAADSRVDVVLLPYRDGLSMIRKK